MGSRPCGGSWGQWKAAPTCDARKGLKMKANSDGSPPYQVSQFVRDAIRRMHAAPISFFTEEERKALDAYDGPIVSGDPNGRVPENLEEDDNE